MSAMPEIGRHHIYVGDCLTVLAGMAPQTIDVVATSPPYNIGAAYDLHHDAMPRPAYLLWMAEVAAALARVLKPNGSLFLNHNGTYLDPWMAYDVANEFRKHFILQNDICWVKQIGVEYRDIGWRTAGQVLTCNSNRFLTRQNERLFHFTLTGAVTLDKPVIGMPYQDKSNIGRYNDRDLRDRGNTWFTQHETVQSKAGKFNHPATYPPELIELCLRLHGGTDLLVLDPFLGAGATLVAAERCGHRAIGVEISQTYAATAKQRLAAQMQLSEAQ